MCEWANPALPYNNFKSLLGAKKCFKIVDSHRVIGFRAKRTQGKHPV